MAKKQTFTSKLGKDKKKFKVVKYIQTLLSEKTGHIKFLSRMIRMEENENIDQALKIYTLNGAKAAFEENIKGSISMNKLADFVVLDKDITKVDPFEIKDIKIVKTVIGGNTVYEG